MSEEVRPASQARRQDFAFGLACAAVTFLVYVPSLDAGFVATWDDHGYIMHNQVIRSLDLETIRTAFLGFHSPFWAPLTWTSFAVDYQLWGLRPFGFHLTNVLLHAANAGLAFAVSRALLGVPAVGLEGRARRWAALFAALAWSLHPQRVESVAWASQRKDVLSLCFGLVAVLAYLRHARSLVPFWRSRGYALALAAFCLSILSKPTMVALPAVLLILDAWPLVRVGTRGWRPLLLEKLPMMGASAIATGLTLAAHSGAAMPLSEAGMPARGLIALASIWSYLREAVWPLGLSPFHLHPGDGALWSSSYWAAAAAVVALTVGSLLTARRRPAMAAAWGAWLVALAPGLLSTQVSVTEYADRFTYLAALPLALLAAGAAAKALPSLSRPSAIAARCALAAWLALLTALSVRQISYWHDDVALWTRPIELDPRQSGRVWSQRSTAREARGDLRGAREDLDQAIAIAAAKRYGYMQTLYARRARLRVGIGELREAVEDYGRAIAADGTPGRSVTLRERAALLRALGEQGLAAEDERLAAEIEAGL